MVLTFRFFSKLSNIKGERLKFLHVLRLGFNHKKSPKPIQNGTFSLFCDPGGILTPDRWSRNPVLYTAELRSPLLVDRLKS